ncbi:hypothetical protein QQ045_004309 [Rhodiola kirilowii]
MEEAEGRLKETVEELRRDVSERTEMIEFLSRRMVGRDGEEGDVGDFDENGEELGFGTRYIYYHLLGHEVEVQMVRNTLPRRFGAPGLPELNASQDLWNLISCSGMPVAGFAHRKGHVNWKSSPVVPHNDPTLLFANAATATLHASEAIQMLRDDKEQFDLVITDIQMPEIDGFQLLEMIGLEMDLPVIRNTFSLT